MAFQFVVGEQYTRDQVADIISMPQERRGGAWATGYDEWSGEVVIFANVGTAGRTGHDYGNQWDGQSLIWYGKTWSRRGQAQIDRIISNSVPVHVFWRGTDRSPFTYAGLGTALSASGDQPVQVVWSFDRATAPQPVAQAVPTGAGPEPTEGAPEPAWRRGPPPTTGKVIISRTSGQTDVYVMVLNDPDGAMLVVPDGHVVIKVGMSNDVERRLAELNVGFPRGSKINWTLAYSKAHPDGQTAFDVESACLEQLRRDRQWLSGEFAIVPRSIIPTLV